MTQTVDRMIAEEEFVRLDELLESRAQSAGGMPLEMLDGFFSALIVGPEAVMPSEYLPLALGEEQEWDSMERAQEAFGLLMRLWNHIVWRLDLDLEPGDDDEPGLGADLALPFLSVPDGSAADQGNDEETMMGLYEQAHDDFPLAALWAIGFFRGMALRQDAWDHWLDAHPDLGEDIEELFRLSLIQGTPLEELDLSVEDIPDKATRLEIVRAIPEILQSMNDLRQDELARPPEPVRRAPTPGRNDPCPCGSGKKFKKCCGSPAALH